MKPASLALIVCVYLALASPISDAQQPRKLPEIGFLDPSPSSSPYFEGFKDGLRELGYVEGVTIVLVPQFGDGKSDRLPNLAIELVRRNVDVIVTVGGQPLQRQRTPLSGSRS
jgi:putative ABC transport system substrate-binding protein